MTVLEDICEASPFTRVSKLVMDASIIGRTARVMLDHDLIERHL